MQNLRVITTTAALLAVIAPAAHAVNLVDCQTAEECGIAAPMLDPVIPTGGVAGVGAGDLLKLANDHDSATHEDEAVYYLDKDWVRRAFPTQAVYKSWYPDFSGVKELTREQMARFRLGKNVVYRPGTRLIKIPSIPKVYAVEPGGALRWIETESVAKTLFGDEWAKRVDDVSETLFTDYRETVALTAPAWPTGTVVRRNEDGALFLIDGFGRRTLTDASLSTMHLNTAHAIRASEAAIAAYPEIGTVTVDERRYKDTAQQDFLETLPAPQFDIVETSREIVAGQESVLASLRVVSGMPIIIRQVRFTLSGPIRGIDGLKFSDLKVTDKDGKELYGIQQLPADGGDSDVFTFGGAYTIAAAITGELQVRAKVAASGFVAGSQFTVSFDRAGLSVADGGNGDALTRYYKGGEFPVITARVK